MATGPLTTFDWDPECEVSALWVQDRETADFNWAIEGAFKPPIDFGVKPKGSKTLRVGEPLQPGRRYQVEVFGAGPYGIHTKGKREFTAR